MNSYESLVSVMSDRVRSAVQRAEEHFWVVYDIFDNFIEMRLAFRDRCALWIDTETGEVCGQ